MKTFFLTASILAVSLSVVAAPSQNEVLEQLTKIGAEQIQLAGDTRDLAEKLDREFKSGAGDNDEMKKIRKELDAKRSEAASVGVKLLVLENELSGKLKRTLAFGDYTDEMKSMHGKVEMLKTDAAAIEAKLLTMFKANPKYVDDFKKIDAAKARLLELYNQRKKLSGE